MRPCKKRIHKAKPCEVRLTLGQYVSLCLFSDTRRNRSLCSPSGLRTNLYQRREAGSEDSPKILLQSNYIAVPAQSRSIASMTIDRFNLPRSKRDKNNRQIIPLQIINNLTKSCFSILLLMEVLSRRSTCCQPRALPPFLCSPHIWIRNISYSPFTTAVSVFIDFYSSL